MNLQAIESIVRRLFSDAEFRAQAISDPSSALGEYRLAADEQRAVTKLCVQLAGDGRLAADGTKVAYWW